MEVEVLGFIVGVGGIVVVVAVCGVIWRWASNVNADYNQRNRKLYHEPPVLDGPEQYRGVAKSYPTPPWERS